VQVAGSGLGPTCLWRSPHSPFVPAIARRFCVACFVSGREELGRDRTREASADLSMFRCWLPSAWQQR
jgi:hypothetical protein